jgi:hypothetical protein
LATPSATESAIWDVIVAEAATESSLWAEALLPEIEQRRDAVFSALAEPRYALGIETIYEGYLLHYGTPRLFSPPDSDAALLLGDYLYAHGLVRIAATGCVDAVRDLAELISLCAQAQANGTDSDWAVWAATAATLGEGVLDPARRALRSQHDAGPLEQVARDTAADGTLERALAEHRRHLP